MNKLSILLVLFVLPALAADADPEIEHLLAFVAGSGCEFERNGSLHTSEEARDHMRLKYRNAGRYIDTAEDFIRYAATGSSISGRPYHVVCAGQRMTSREWLLEELRRYRAGNAT